MAEFEKMDGVSIREMQAADQQNRAVVPEPFVCLSDVVEALEGLAAKWLQIADECKRRDESAYELSFREAAADLEALISKLKGEGDE